jgi:NRAMP (natural resistance-associated macrophage protein)-like metal ion transporter
MAETGKTATPAQIKREPNPLKRVLMILGPGLITGASDDDPSGIGTFAQAGAALGYSSLWTAIFTFPLMTSVQYICAKVGLVTGRGLAGVLRTHFSQTTVFPAVMLLVVANTINVGVDIGAIAAAIGLLVPIPPALFVVPVAIVIVALLVFGSYEVISRVIRWLTLALFAYVASAFFARPDLGAVLRNTFLPDIHLDPTYILTIQALLGTTISPYLFFYQAEDEVETEISIGRRSVRQRKGATKDELRFAGIDVTAGMFFSQVVMYFVILATGATLHQAGTTHVESAAEAAKALQPLAGDAAGLLWAVGLIGSGLLAVPVLAASASYAVAEAFQWKRGLDEKPTRAPRFYLVMAISVLIGVLVNFVGINPIDALFYTAVLNGLLAPPLLVLVMVIANDRKIMATRTNGALLNVMGWGTALLMFVLAVAWATLTLVGA